MKMIDGVIALSVRVNANPQSSANDSELPQVRTCRIFFCFLFFFSVSCLQSAEMFAKARYQATVFRTKFLSV